MSNWLEHQLDNVKHDVENWPEWKKREAGIPSVLDNARRRDALARRVRVALLQYDQARAGKLEELILKALEECDSGFV